MNIKSRSGNGSFNNHVDQIPTNFDHLVPSSKQFVDILHANYNLLAWLNGGIYVLTSSCPRSYWMNSNLKKYFQFSTILKKMNQINIPQLFTLGWKVEGQWFRLFFGGWEQVENV